MDLETENRIAAILLKEAAELRRQAQQEGALAYLKKPTVRGRPISRFLTATVRGIQQANRAVEVNEMWRVRQKEVELEERLNGRSKDDRSRDRREERDRKSSRKRYDEDGTCSSSKRSYEDRDSNDEGLRDEELEKFLHSRAKRGRGSVGSRMDETGPYLPRSSESEDELCATADHMKGKGRHRAVFGPEKPASWKSCESSGGESDSYRRKRSKKSSETSEDVSDEDRHKRLKKSSSNGSKERPKKHKSKKCRDKKKKKGEKRSKH